MGRTRKAAYSGFADRVRQVIDEREGGNVSAASRRIGFSQRGLQKIYVGQTEVPGADIIREMCLKYGVDPAWMITGQTSEEWVQHGGWVEERARRIAAEMLAMISSSLDPEVSIGSVAGGGSPVVTDPDSLRALADHIESSAAKGGKKKVKPGRSDRARKKA